jgi:CRISPR-associated protein Csx17
MPEIVLSGCTPEPLMSYLKTLAVFRLVAEQADPATRLSWAGGVARLHSVFERHGLIEFFLEKYQATAVLAPWNKGSGFYAGGTAPLNAIAGSTSDRLMFYRETITAIRKFPLAAMTKDAILTRCRAELPDELVPWLDTCYVLGEERPSYFPLLGTGGNDGRLDFTNNFMQRLADVIPFAAGASPTVRSTQWLAAALFADTLVELGDAAVGQFNPGGIGGANATQRGFEAASRVNPWDFVLMIEGALLLAGSVARRLGASSWGRAVFPFSVDSVAVGYGSATAGEETNDGSRAELWLPLWTEPMTFPEVKHLFAEGRAQFGRRQARNAVEFALAVNLLGVSRGVQSFARYGFLKRNGLAFLAAPLGRVEVTPRPRARLLDDQALTGWIERLRSACRDKERTPARYQTALRQFDRAVYQFANRSEQGNDAKYLQDVLRAIGRAEQTLASGQAFCADKNLSPLQGLNPRWLIDAAPAGETGREFRLAASVASVMAEPRTDLGPLCTHLEPVEQERRRLSWSPGSPSVVWSNRPTADNLAAVLVRRLIESERAGVRGCSLRARITAPLDDVVAFINRQTNDDLLAHLLWALIGLKWSADDFRQLTFVGQRAEVFRAPLTAPVPMTLGLIRMVLTPLKLISARPRSDHGPEGFWRVAGREERGSAALTTTPTPAPFQKLARGNVPEAEDLAARRLWSDRLVPFGWTNRKRRQSKYQTGSAVDPVRLLAACLFPLSRSSLTRIARQVLTPPVVNVPSTPE